MATQSPEAGGLGAQLRRLDDRFWIVNTMEMLERLAYYGVRGVIPIYMVLAPEAGGPGLDHVQKGAIFAAWAAVQSLLPMFTGGLADRYGHKNTIVVAILFKVLGYLGMALSVSHGPFFAACMLLATGTALFKPGVQGTLAATLKGPEAPVGWGIFYQVVNIGGFLGPMLAGALRLLEWDWVFLSCAGIVLLNLLWLPFYRDSTQDLAAARAAGAPDGRGAAWAQIATSTRPGAARGWASLLLGAGLVWSGALVFGLFARPEAFLGALHPGVALGGLAALLGSALAAGALGAGIGPTAGRAFAPAMAAAAAAAALVADHSGALPIGIDALEASGRPGLSFFLRFASGSFLSWGLPALAAPLLRFAAAPERYARPDQSALGIITLSVLGLFTPRVLWFCLIFAGFWLTFNQVFDLLPNSIDDWVNSGDVLADLGAALSLPGASAATLAAGALAAGGVVAALLALVMHPERAGARLSPARTALVALIWAGGLSPLLWGASGAGRAALSLGCVVAAGLSRRRPGTSASLLGGAVASLAVGLGLWTPAQTMAAELQALAAAGGQVNPEWMINLNAGLIVTTMVFVAKATDRLPALWSIILGMVLATLGGAVAGTATTGWACLGGLAVFSLGEMLSSPKKLEYLASLAPSGQEGLYMGYANIPVAIGWIAGSVIAGDRYERDGDKINLARRYLVEQLGQPEAERLPRADVLGRLAEALHTDGDGVRLALLEAYAPGDVWLQLAAWGAASVVGMIAYDQVVRRLDRARAASAQQPAP